MTEFIPDESTLILWGKQFASQIKPGEIIFLQGQLGAGKTTLVRGILQGLGFQDAVKSPTYTLVESYVVKNNLTVFHFDLYRLHSSQELLDIGLEDYLTADSICLIEWPEKALDVLPKPTISCTIEIPKNKMGRLIQCVRGELNY